MKTLSFPLCPVEEISHLTRVSPNQFLSEDELLYKLSVGVWGFILCGEKEKEALSYLLNNHSDESISINNIKNNTWEVIFRNRRMTYRVIEWYREKWVSLLSCFL